MHVSVAGVLGDSSSHVSGVFHDRATPCVADRALSGLGTGLELVVPRITGGIGARRDGAMGGPALAMAGGSWCGAARPSAVCRDRPFRCLAARNLRSAALGEWTDRARS